MPLTSGASQFSAEQVENLGMNRFIVTEGYFCSKEDMGSMNKLRQRRFTAEKIQAVLTLYMASLHDYSCA